MKHPEFTQSSCKLVRNTATFVTTTPIICHEVRSTEIFRHISVLRTLGQSGMNSYLSGAILAACSSARQFWSK